MFEDFARFVAKNYASARKIVEVGVGHRIDVAIEVKSRLPNTEVVVTDKDESWIRLHKTPRVKAVVDDIDNPRLALYEGAALVYSLQPPLELVPSLVSLAGRVCADLLVVPVMDEQEAFHTGGWKKVTQLGRTLGWLLPHHHHGWLQEMDFFFKKVICPVVIFFGVDFDIVWNVPAVRSVVARTAVTGLGQIVEAYCNGWPTVCWDSLRHEYRSCPSPAEQCDLLGSLGLFICRGRT